MLGTIVNTITVIIGSFIGLFLHTRLPERLTRTAFNTIGIFTIFIGITMALKTSHILILVFSILPGAIIGELLQLEERLNRFTERLRTRLRLKGSTFTEGLLAAFLLFCMGSMTILGAIEEGTGNTPNLYFTKALLDGFAAIALAAGLGIGVLLSAIPLFLYQATLTLLARLLNTILRPGIVDEITAVGGLILISLGINILQIKKLKILNLLPGLIIALILGLIFIH